jgi:uncharacterized RDD family membrane protein YckC
MPWERPGPPSNEPRSTIISATPLITDQPGVTQPEVAWAPPPPPTTGREVPGAAGFVFGSVLARFAAWFVDNMLLLILGIILATIAALVLGVDTEDDATTVGVAIYVFYTLLTALYFIGFWTSGRRATLAMRALNLQVGTAFDGRTLPLGSAVIRWVVLGYPLAVVVLVPALAGLAGVVSLLLPIVLVISTIASNTKQGLHDRAAGSAVVKPIGARTSPAALTCVVILVLVPILVISGIILLIFLGGQIEEILREAGQSI